MKPDPKGHQDYFLASSEGISYAALATIIGFGMRKVSTGPLSSQKALAVTLLPSCALVSLCVQQGP